MLGAVDSALRHPVSNADCIHCVEFLRMAIYSQSAVPSLTRSVHGYQLDKMLKGRSNELASHQGGRG